MHKKKASPNRDSADIARATVSKMSDEERRDIHAFVQAAVNERNLPKFQAGLLKLGFDEESAAYEKMMKLWDEHARASRRP